VFSTMILLNLRPLEAVKALALEGLYIELDYDNFALFGGKHAEDAMLKEVVNGLGEDLKRFVRTVHMPYDEIDADVMPLESIVERMVKWLDVASRIGVEVAVFHTIKTVFRNPLETNLEFFRTVVKEAMERGIMVAVENRLEKELFGSSPKDLKELVETIGEGIGVCLDVGHANITKTLQQFLNTVGEHIVELHLHDNDGQKDLHRPPQTGTVNWSLITQWLKKRAGVIPVFEISCRESVKNCIAIAKSASEWFAQH